MSRGRGPTDPSIFSTQRSFSVDVGSHIGDEEVAGYYVGFKFKAPEAGWPPSSLAPKEEQFHVATAQWALGCYERHLDGEGDGWLDSAIGAADYLVEHQEQEGAIEGAWVHLARMPHTYRLNPPWISAMAQGEAASLLVRMHRETGEDRYAEAAIRALKPLSKDASKGGVRAELEGGPFFEEYPTEPPSFVLNGGIFALWGVRDVGLGLGEKSASDEYERGVKALAENIDRWDTGYWSLYDLYPHPLANIASSAYHGLHITQLEAMERITPDPKFRGAIDRFRQYAQSDSGRARAFGAKVAFRLAVPRNRLLAHRMPWADRGKGRRE